MVFSDYPPRSSVSTHEVTESRWIIFARFLYILNVAAMLKAFALTNFVEVMLWLLFITQPVLRRSFAATFAYTPVRLVFVFWLWVAIACLWGDAAPSDRMEEVLSWRKLLLVPMGVALFAQVKHRVSLYAVFVFAASVFLVVSYCIMLGVTYWGDLEARQVLENHSTQGSVFAVAGLFCLYFARDASNHHRYFSCFGLAVLAVAFWLNILLLGSSRTPLIAILLFTIVMPIMLVRLRLAVVIIATICSCIFALVNSPYANNVNKRVGQAYSEFVSATETMKGESSSVGMRVQMWIISSEIIQDNPLLGSGSGSYKNRFEEYARNHPDWIAVSSDDPHQQYLLIWAEQGGVGLLLFLAALCLIFRVGGGVLLNSRNDKGRQEIASLILVLGYFVISSFANGHFGTFVEGRISWITAALLLACCYRKNAA